MRASVLVAGVLGAALLVVVPPGSPARASPGPAACSAGLIALTFDDGPAPTVTPDLLALLAARRVPATFFMVGSRVASHPALVRRVQRLGFVIGNHTYRHEDLTTLSDAGTRSTLARTRRALVRAGVRPSPLMRPPYRATNARVRRVTRAMGLTQVLWTIDPRDWESGTSSDIARRVLRALRPHQPNIVLLHDGVGRSPITLRAVPRIIHGARQRGYCFAALGPAGRPAPPVPTVTASAPEVTEGSLGEITPVTVTLRLDQPTSRRVSLRLRTTSGSAAAGEDFLPVSRRVRFPVGVTKRSVPVSVLGDDLAEGDESLLVVLDRPYRLRMAGAPVTVTIVDDDGLPPVAAWSTLAGGAGSGPAPPSPSVDPQRGTAGRAVPDGQGGASPVEALDTLLLAAVGAFGRWAWRRPRMRSS
jgi:peptidoglycan/xylan/chitin deacetylase (PgdA/CDA1 family)